MADKKKNPENLAKDDYVEALKTLISSETFR